MNRLKQKYNEKIQAKLKEDFKLRNIMQVPKITKVCINVGIGSFRENREAVESFATDFGMFAGQKPYPRNARLSVAGFKIRQGDTIGYAVTLRGERMWAFLDKFINISLPRVRDFRGLNAKSFDKNGNYSTGIQEHVIFPEVNPNSVKGIRSLQITIVFNSKNSEVNKALLQELGMPFKK
jgi:large subunit ribosomal protein L5